MNMKNVVSIVKMLAVLILLMAGATIAFGQWQGPPGSPPGNNVPPPINVSNTLQIKDGAYWVTNEVQADNLTTFFDTYLSTDPNQVTYVGTGGTGGSPSTNALFNWGSLINKENATFEKAVEIQNSDMADPALNVQGIAHADVNFRASNLENNYTNLDLAWLCAEQDGTIVLCDPPSTLQSVSVVRIFDGEDCNSVEHSFQAYPNGGSAPNISYVWERRGVYPSSGWVQFGGSGSTTPVQSFTRSSPVIPETYTYEVRATATDSTTGTTVVGINNFNVPPPPPGFYDQFGNWIPCPV